MIGDESKVEAWKLAKWGKFSASEIFKLDVAGPAGMFGDGAMTYIKKIARQAMTLYNDRDEVETLAMKNGKMDESVAYGHLYKLLGLEQLEYYGGSNPLFKDYNADSGASPDVIAWVGGRPSFGADLKCPTGDKHFDYLLRIKRETDLRVMCKDYWCQAQFSCMAFDVGHWLWCSYNEFFPPSQQMHIIEVPKNKMWCDNMHIKLLEAIKIKYDLINQVKK